MDELGPMARGGLRRPARAFDIDAEKFLIAPGVRQARAMDEDVGAFSER